MASPVTLLTMRTRVRELADIGGDTTAGRYPNDRLNREINMSWQRAREIAVMQGDGLMYLRQTGPTLMASGCMDSTSSFNVIRWPDQAVQIHGIDVRWNGGAVSSPSGCNNGNNIYSLQPMSWGDRNIFCANNGFSFHGGSTGRPIGFCIINIGDEVNCNVSSGRIAIFPAPDQEYTYTCWYIPVWEERTEDDHVFNGINGHTDWAIWDVVIKIAAADADMQNVAQLAMSEREKAEAMLTSRVNRLQRVGPYQRRDIQAQQRYSRFNLAGRWR